MQIKIIWNILYYTAERFLINKSVDASHMTVHGNMASVQM